MFRIRNFVSVVSDYDGSGRVVHGFYRDSFAALYGLEVSDINEECSYISTHTDLLCPLVKAAAKGFEHTIRFFYDVRTSEEFEQTSPEYSLLASAGLNHVSPLCIRSNNGTALLTALQIAMLDIKDEPALFCCSDLPNRFDANFGGVLRASAFLLFKNL